MSRRNYATQKQAAEYLGVTERTVRQMIGDGRLIGYRSGKRLVRVDLDEVDAAMVPFGGGAVGSESSPPTRSRKDAAPPGRIPAGGSGGSSAPGSGETSGGAA